jgi:cell division septal protein FtsQ
MSNELFRRSTPEKRVDWERNRRGFSAFRHFLKQAAKAVLAVGVVGAAVWSAPRALSLAESVLHRQEYLTAKRLILEGNVLVGREEILEALGIGAGQSLLDLDLPSLALRLERIPAIKSAVVTREFPSGLLVRVVERTPFVVVEREGERFLLDEEGVVMGRAPEGTALPLVTGVTLAGGTIQDRAALLDLLELREATLATGAGWPGVFTLIDLSGLEGPVATVDSSVLVRLGRGNYAEKLAQFNVALPRIRGGPQAAFIDLRFAKRVVVGTRPPEKDARGNREEDSHATEG